jgi:hypothetical protein
MHWPYKMHKITRPSEGDSRTAGEQTMFEPLADLHTALHDAVLPVRWFGQSNLESYYVEQWLRACDKMDHKYSHLFLTSSTVTFKARKLTMGCRFDVATTHKQLHRYGAVRSPQCPLGCGQNNNCHHAISGCPKLSTAVTNRHNDAGSLIVEAIYKSPSAWAMLLSDVGIRKRWQDRALPEGLQCSLTD